MLILDFDLDFIVRPIRRGVADQASRYEGPEVTIWSEKTFQSLMEGRLGLSATARLPGRACEHHKEVFGHVERLIADGALEPPFDWVHVDAHDDISGCSDARPMTSANFLLHLIGRDWIRHIDFVLPEGEEYPPDCLIKWNPLRIEFNKHRCTIDYLDQGTYCMPRRPDFIFLTRSPDFTPSASDSLFDIARGYIEE